MNRTALVALIGITSCSRCAEEKVVSVSDTQIHADARMLANVLGEFDRLEKKMHEMNRAIDTKENPNRGLLTEEQEERIALAYQQFLTYRKAFFHILFRHQNYNSITTEQKRDASFLLAYAAGLTLYRNGVTLVVTFKDHHLIRTKLNEADTRFDTEAGMFDQIYANILDDKNVDLILEGIAAYHASEERLKDHALLKTPGLEQLPDRLSRYETELREAHDHLSEGRRDLNTSQLKKTFTQPIYRAQSLIALLVGHLRVPLHSGGLQPNAIGEIAALLEPGDILITRRDGYLSNSFLPGYWGHAALYIGTHEQLEARGLLDAAQLDDEYERADEDGYPLAAIEAIGEGVRFSSLEFALHANHVAIFRPSLNEEQRLEAVARAVRYLGSPYDFSFDFGSKDKLVCTELIYRAYDPVMPIPLEPMMGRLALIPDNLAGHFVAPKKQVGDLILHGEEVKGALLSRSREELLANLP